jgi:hypothetical protein
MVRLITGTGDDRCIAIQQTTDGGYMAAGASQSNDGDVTFSHGDYDFWLAKLDALGNLEWQKPFGGTAADYATAIQQTADGGYVAAGYSASNDIDVSGNHGNRDYWVVKFAPNVGIGEIAGAESFISVFPNPATNHLILKCRQELIERVEIFNTLGEKVYDKAEGFQSNAETINVRKLTPGIYFVRVKMREGEKTLKFVKD